MWRLGLILSFGTVALALFPGGRFLEDKPDPNLCAQRTLHAKFQNKGYFFSWRDPITAKQEEDWLGVRNWCRKRCMDSISLQTSEKNDWAKQQLIQDKVRYIWTSGRLCDFDTKCDRPDLLPKSVNGWFWSSDKQRLAPTTQRQQNDWSSSGGIGKSQPDNREELQNGAKESCLGLLNNFYGDGIHWHDVACHHRKPFICEDSDELLSYVRFNNKNLFIK